MEDKTSIINTVNKGSVSFYCKCGAGLTIHQGDTYTCSCGLTYHCKYDIKLLMEDWEDT